MPVVIEFERKVDDVSEFADCELIVAADGANSAIRRATRSTFSPRSTSGRICLRGTARHDSSSPCR
jgi:2-polyprenyl-6-methoxyphenol hydroxylase-like FAD-dependent oxidoreductase